jgi:hypothetical protein
MKFQLSLAIAAAALTLGSQAAFADRFISGTVYRTAPNGVYLNTANGITFIPNNSATFQSGRRPISVNRMRVGAPIQAYYTNNYSPYYVPTEYYNLHRDWDWNRYSNGWRRDRQYWHQSNGRWYR